MALTPDQVVSGLVRRGIPQNAAIGFAGNFQIESGLDPAINEIAPVVQGSRGGFGLAQWTGPRRKQLEAFAGSQGRSVDDPELQMDFLAWELQNTEKRARDKIYQAANPEEAASLISTEFLRPGVPHLERRIQATRDIYGGGNISGGAGDVALSGGGDDNLSATELLKLFDNQTEDAVGALNEQTEQQELSAAELLKLFDTEPEPLDTQAPAELESLAGRGGAEPSFARGLGLGLRDVAQGAAGTVGLLYDPLAAAQDYILGTETPGLREQVSGLATRAGLPEAETEAERLRSSIVEGASGALTGAGLSGAVARGAGGIASNVAGQMAAQPVVQAVSGGSAGGAAQLAAESGAGPVGQTAAALGGALAGGAVGGVGGMRRVTTPQAADDIVSAGAERGVRVLTSDVRPPRTYASRWALASGEKIPLVGTGGQRAAQAQERAQAIRDVFSEFSENPGAWTDDVLAQVSDDLRASQSRFVGKYSALKNEALETVADAGPVPVPKTQARIGEILAKLEGKEQFRGLREQISAWSRDLGTNTDIKDVDFMRKALGEAFKDPSLAAVRKQGEELISSLYKPLRQDIDAFVSQNGGQRALTKLRVANKRLSDNMSEISNSALRSVLSKSEATPESVRRILFSSNASDVRRLYKTLSREGKATARAAILHDAIERSGGLEGISAKRFVSQLDKRARQIGVFFSGDDRATIDGLARVLKATQRADEAALLPPTGAQLIPIAAAGTGVGFGQLSGLGPLGTVLAGAGAAGGLGGFARVYESPVMRRTLINLSKVKPGSPAEARLVQRAITIARESQKEMEQSNVR